MSKAARHRGVLKKAFAFTLIFVFLFHAFFVTANADEIEPETIRVGIFPYAEQLQRDESGNHNGYGYDYLQEVAKYTGWRYEFVDVPWDTCLQMLETGEIDLMGALMRSPQREEVFAFSAHPMISGYGVLATSLDNKTVPFEDFDAFENLRIGALKGNLHLNNFISYSNTHGFTANIREYSSQAELDKALETNEIDAMIMTNLLRSSTMRVVATFGENDGYFATTKGNDKILNQLNYAMRQIRLNDPYFNSVLDQKHYNLQAETPVSFTQEELDFIENAPPIPSAFVPDAYPISYFDKESNSVEGISAEICKLLEARTGLTFRWVPEVPTNELVEKMQSGEILLLPAKHHDYLWAEKNNLWLTDPYLQGQMVMLSGSTVAVPETIALYGDDSQELLAQSLYDTEKKIQQYGSVLASIDAVLAGDADATFVSSTVASYLMNDPKYSRLQSTPLYDYAADMSMAVSQKADPLLLSVLDKGLRNISATEINEIILSQMQHSQASPVATYLYLHPSQVVAVIIFISAISLLALCVLLFFKLKSNHQLQQTLYTDPLTGYPNYQSLLREAPALINAAPGQYAVIYLDIRRFKAINDTLGYETGDKVLIMTSEILHETIKEKERFARLYADVFVLLLLYDDQPSLQERLEELSHRLWQMCPEGIAVRPLFFGGVYLLPKNYESLDKACDRANYAKDSITQHFSNSFVFYNDIMRKRILEEKELEGSMERALACGEFVPFYQPKLNIITEKVAGAEALVRWYHPEKGLLPPVAFLPFYEKSGFIVKIDLAIFEQVCKDLQSWLQQGNDGVTTSVNFSRRHMENPDLPLQLKTIADRYGVPTRFLEIEVTETEELESAEIAVAFVAALKSYGFKVSIDDYGTGYSSLSFLQQLPLDALKLDRKFLLNAMESDKASDIMRHLVAAMHKNGILVICEGVETLEQRDFVLNSDCRLVQGFFYSRPLPVGEFRAYLLHHGIDSSDMPDFAPIVDFEEKSLLGMDELLTKSLPPRVVATLAKPGYPVQYISPGLLDGMGYSYAEFLKETKGMYVNLVHPEDLPRALELLAESEHSDTDLILQYRLRKKDGSYIWIREINKRAQTKSGEPLFLSLCTDVDDIVRLQSEKIALMNAIPGGVGTLILTAEGPVILQATERFYEVIGYSQEEMEELDNNLCHIFYEKDLPSAMGILSDFLSSKTDSCGCNFRVQLKNGELHWVSFRGALSGSDSEIRVTVVVFDGDDEIKAKQALEKEKAKLELAISSAGQSVFEYDIADLTIHDHINFDRYGIAANEVLHIPDDLLAGNFLHPEDADKPMEAHQRLVAGEEQTSYEIRILTKRFDPSSPYIWVRITLSNIFDEGHHPIWAVGIVEDINQQKRYEQKFLLEAQYRRAFTESSLMAYEVNLTQDTVQRLTGSRGFRLEELQSRLPHPDSYVELLHAATPHLVAADDREMFQEAMSQAALLDLHRRGVPEKELEYRRITPDEQELWNSVLVYLVTDQMTGDVMAYVYHRDIQERKNTEQELIAKAARDSLTGVFNRAAAERLTRSYLQHSNTMGHIQAFLMMDLDHFKKINDTYGHLTGDQCLVHLVEILTKLLRKDDIIARMGGDEFAVLLKNLPNEETALSIAKKLTKAVKTIGPSLGMTLPTGVSIGIAISPRHGTTFEDLYRLADEAMYEAKHRQKHHIKLSEKDLYPYEG